MTSVLRLETDVVRLNLLHSWRRVMTTAGAASAAGEAKKQEKRAVAHRPLPLPQALLWPVMQMARD